MVFVALFEDRIFILIFSLCVGILFIFVYTKVNYCISSNKLKRRFAKSRTAEKGAEKLLRKKGYSILDIQKSKPILITIGDKIHRYFIRIDFLVKKKGKVYVVEVKNGEKNPYITNRETRRQMLEYYHAYQPHGIILLNMRNKNISEVKFQFEKNSRQWIVKAAYFLAGIIVTFFAIFMLHGGME